LAAALADLTVSSFSSFSWPFYFSSCGLISVTSTFAMKSFNIPAAYSKSNRLLLARAAA
jgi:hypothetical protein